MNNKKFCFYFDESYHDRKICLNKKGKLNIFDKERSDTFVGAFVGVENYNIKDFEKKFLEFEDKYKKFYGISDQEELKGTTIAKKNFKSGIATLNTNAVKFYLDFFDILIEYKCIFQLNLFSKIEALVVETLKNEIEKISKICNYEKFIYSITKFIFNYKDLGIAEKFFEYSNELSRSDIICEIRDGLNLVLRKIDCIKRKEVEKSALKELIGILDYLDVKLNLDEKIKWNYDTIFYGFDLLLKDMNISPFEVEVKLDKEDNILASAQKNNKYCELGSYDSKDVIGIRCADILSNFFGRLIYSIQTELSENDLIDIKKELKLIDKKWFNLNEEQFLLVKKIGKLFGHQKYYSTYTSIYFDYPFTIFNYIYYINEYDTFKEFKMLGMVEHKKEGNEYIVFNHRDELLSL
ncbi:hypothetical protein K1514_15635 [Paraclostridium bifermentans]|uniref:hypothetical protein n=1 Tax=Paraclostridium TaxID=1849822 RepID=UPI001CC46AB5|nr:MULTISPECIES: hypothetical protein [Paraclostridium]MBZ6007324.1 hypothetical protein [Paraclostridium bifermentans]MDU0297452.1 hypothetical protein [Paraclostridium sp. MRS3W1]